MPLTTEQFDAICDAQDANPQLAELSADEAAAKLKAEGHEAFADWQPEGSDEAPTKKASAPVEPILEEDDRTPDLEVGAPKVLAAATTTAVAKREPEQKHEVARPAATACSVEGGEALEAGDFAIPQLKIKQGQTTDKDESGVKDVPDGHLFLTSEPEEHSESRTIVVLDVLPGRSFMLPFSDEEKRYSILERCGLEDVVPEDAKVLCSSNDRKLPVVRDWPSLSETCADCSHANWRKVKGGSKSVQDCSENYRMIVVDTTDEDVPALLFLKGSAVRPTRSLLTNLRVAAGRESEKRKEPVGFYGFSVEVTTRAKQGPGGEFHVPRFGRPKPLDQEDAEHFRNLRRQFVKDEQGGEA